jgi:hypothetical protein
LDGVGPLRMTVKKFQEYVSSFVHLYLILSIGGRAPKLTRISLNTHIFDTLIDCVASVPIDSDSIIFELKHNQKILGIPFLNCFRLCWAALGVKYETRFAYVYK